MLIIAQLLRNGFNGRKGSYSTDLHTYKLLTCTLKMDFLKSHSSSSLSAGPSGLACTNSVPGNNLSNSAFASATISLYPTRPSGGWHRAAFAGMLSSADTRTGWLKNTASRTFGLCEGPSSRDPGVEGCGDMSGCDVVGCDVVGCDESAGRAARASRAGRRSASGSLPQSFGIDRYSRYLYRKCRLQFADFRASRNWVLATESNFSIDNPKAQINKYPYPKS